MFFIHPQHGAMNASESEAPALEKQGWKRSTHDEWFRMNGKPHLCSEPEEAEEESDASPDQPQPARRRGRPPKAK